MNARTVPLYEDHSEILRLLMQTMQHKDDRWRVSVPLLLLRMQSTSGVGSRSKLVTKTSEVTVEDPVVRPAARFLSNGDSEEQSGGYRLWLKLWTTRPRGDVRISLGFCLCSALCPDFAGTARDIRCLVQLLRPLPFRVKFMQA